MVDMKYLILLGGLFIGFTLSAQSTWCVNEEDIPNVFSPNFDGSNDVFRVNNCDYTLMEVYNRWGELIFRTQNSYWDGRTSVGIEAPEGIYFCIIEGEGIRLARQIRLVR